MTIQTPWNVRMSQQIFKFFIDIVDILFVKGDVGSPFGRESLSD